MRPLVSLFPCVASMFGFCLSLQAEVRFEGILRAGKSPQFALVEDSTGETRWVSKGDPFAGYIITAYDEAGKRLSLVKEGIVTEVHLRALSNTHPVVRQDVGSDWRKNAESLAESGDETIASLLSDYDTASSEAIGLDAFLTFARANRTEGMTEEDWKKQLAESEKDLVTRQSSARLFKDAIAVLLAAK